MDTGPGLHAPSTRRPAWHAWSGVALTVALIALIETLRPTTLHFPGPGVPLLIMVALASYLGSLLPSVVSCALAIAYGAWFFMGPAAEADPSRVRRVVDLAVGAVVIAGVMGVLRRRADRARRLTADAAVAQQYAMLFEEAGEPMLLSDSTHRYVFVNRRACEVSGYAREELLRMRVGDLVSRRSLTDQPLRMDELPSRGELRVERELVRRDGTSLTVDVTARRLEDGSTLAILRDVTLERESVERLQHAYSLVRATLESTTDGILAVDHDGRWSGFNRKFAEMWRLPPEILDESNDDRALAFAATQLEAPEQFLERVRALYATPEENSFDEIRFRDGRVFERYSIPQRFDDCVIGRVWSFRDVTAARQQLEALRATEQRLIHSEKMEAVGRLAGGIAHDFNNMLTAILGETDILLLQPTLDPRVRTQVEHIRRAALRNAHLTRQLLAYARRQHTEPRTFPLSKLVSELEPLIRRLAGQHVVLRLELPPEARAVNVHADPGQIEQAILNLVINASDAMPDGGHLLVRVEPHEVRPDGAAGRGAQRTGAHVRLTIKDDGDGIPAAALPYLFEPFFTTKPPGKGTGLGLASVHGIVHQAHGFIEVESQPGHGSAFHILLPWIDAETDASESQQPHSPAATLESPRARAPVVLVVDDEEQVRRFVVAVLSDAGYDVRAAASAEEALGIAAAESEPLALLLTDVVMPGTNGPALARALRGEGRDVQVVFMSGYPGNSLREHLGELGNVPLIEKPFRSGELLERVRAALAHTV